MFWLYQEYLKVWKKAPFCIQLDLTYNINYYKMPFISAVVMTSKQISMPILFGLLYSEQKMDFNWYIDMFKKTQ